MKKVKNKHLVGRKELERRVQLRMGLEKEVGFELGVKGGIDGLRNLFWILLPEDNVYFTYIAK